MEENNKSNTAFEKLNSDKNIYKKFLEDMVSSDIKNTPRRYIIELNILKSIYTQAKECNLDNDIQEYGKKIEEINFKLENEFRVKVKN